MKRIFAAVSLAGMVAAVCAPSAMAAQNKFWACKFGEFYNVRTAHCVSCKTYVTDQAALAKCRSCKGGMTWDIAAGRCTHIGGAVIRK